MGTDRLEIYQGQCPCGKGKVKITFCTPDHPWPTQSKWFETSILCKDCSRRYSLLEQENHFVFVEKEEQRRREEYWREYSRKSDALLSSPDVVALLQELERLLDAQRSMAACHRLLHAYQLDYYSIGTFRKKWAGANNWIKNNIRVGNLRNVMKLLRKKNSRIEKELESIEELYKKYHEPLPIVGSPLIDVSNYKG
ncbi:MAG TPA: hypothetical protein ENI51_05180 [Candidatus Atribacteria bacterium]|nr:hypothetical protein [Candidatus Atribacteria bacterium]